MRLAVRCDASPEIGSGHLMRCLTLADRVRNEGGEALFIMRPQSVELDDLVRGRGHALKLLDHSASSQQVEDADGPAHGNWLRTPWQEDAELSLSAIRDWGGADWLAVDHYAIEARWERQLRSGVPRLMVIDDLADRAHDCDILLDQNLFADMAHRYRGRIRPECRLLVGPRYALLRPEFAKLRLRGERNRSVVRRAMIFFGGSDSGNETGNAIKAFGLLEDSKIALDVVIGASNPHHAQLTDLCRASAHIELHRQVQDMASLMVRSDLAIGAGGSSSWERCALSLPTIAWPLADNQRPVLEALAIRGAAYVPDAQSVRTPRGLAAHLYALIHNSELRSSLAASAGTLCDGLGVDRVFAAMSNVAISLRTATAQDAAPMFEGRNDDTVRRFSADGALIAWDAHCAWLRRTLADPDRLLLIAQREDGTPVAVLRFDIQGSVATASIYAVPGQRSVGAAALAAGEHHLRLARPDVRRISATVLAENPVSAAMFEAGGYARISSQYEKAIQT